MLISPSTVRICLEPGLIVVIISKCLFKSNGGSKIYPAVLPKQ